MTSNRLPRGRHALTRTEVQGAQRARILSALADTMSERGYANTPVSAILSAAGVSRETFYQLFDSKEDCFAAALDDTVDRLASGLRREVLDQTAAPLDSFDRVLGAYLSALESAPSTARLFLVETYAAGPIAMNRRLELQGQFAAGIAQLFEVSDSSFGGFCADALIGAIVSAVTARIVPPGPFTLSGLRRPLVALAGRLFLSQLV